MAYHLDEKIESKTLRDHEAVINHNPMSAQRATYRNSHYYLSDSDSDSDDEDIAKHGEQYKQEGETRRTKVIRGVVIAIVVTVIVLSCTEFIFLLLKPEQPSIQLDSFSISKFNISKSRLSYEWKANYTVTNPDFKYSTLLSTTASFVFFKDHILSLTMEPEEGYDQRLSPKEKTVVSFGKFEEFDVPPEKKDVDESKLNKEEMGKRNVENQNRELLDAVRADVNGTGNKGRTLSISTDMYFEGIAMADSWWERRVDVSGSCGNLTVRFVSETDAAAVLGGHGRTCPITFL